MKSTLLLTFLLFVLFFIPAYGEQGRGVQFLLENLDENAKPGRQYLLLIGIDKYKEWPILQQPVKDIKEVRDVLLNRYYIDDVIELYNGEATKKKLIQTFEELQKNLKHEDSLLIFYSGHGHLDAVTNSGFWIPVDAGKDVYEQDNWLPNSQVKGFVSNMKASHILLISDSCFSGRILSNMRALNEEISHDYFKKAYSLTSRQVLTSASTEMSPDDSEFSFALKRALEKNENDYLDPLMLFDQIRRSMVETTPLLGTLKETGHQEGASFLLFLKQPVYGYVEITTATDGKLFIDGMYVKDIHKDKLFFEEIEIGEHILRILYEDEQGEEKQVSVTEGKTEILLFNYIPTPKPTEKPGPDPTPEPDREPDITPEPEAMTPGPTEGPEPEDTKRFLAGVCGTFNLPARESLGVASPFAGCDLTSEWRMIQLSTLFLCLSLNGGYIYHPKAEEAEYLDNFHLLNLGLGIKSGFVFSSSVPISIGLLISSGVTVSIIARFANTETNYLFNPHMCVQIDFQYDIGETFVFIAKIQYLAVIGGNSFGDWYHETSFGVGLGIRF